MKKFLLGLSLLLMSLSGYAFQPLPADQAFALSAQTDNKTLQLHWTIASGYYLYRDRFSFNVKENVTLPRGIAKEDEMLGKYQVYEHEVTVAIPITSATTNVIVKYQGCAVSGFCYPAATKKVSLQTDGVVTIADVSADDSMTLNAVSSTGSDSMPSQDHATWLLANHNWLLTLFGFLGFGLLLTFTPCVLPLLPILSGIIVGQGASLTTGKAFRLSLTYVLAMAVAYAAAGVLAGLAGSYVQAFLQNPWVLVIFSMVFVLLALSLFGLFELQLPVVWQEKLTNLSNRQTGGTYVGVAIMGALSVLIISPCVTAPLIGVLGYIGKTGDALFGGATLFMMGLGFGLPLLIVGTIGGKLLPKAGRWMNTVKMFFGVVMLLIAIWLLLRIPLVVQWVEPVMLKFTTTQSLPFKTIKSAQDLENALANAKAQHKPVMLDFYADWCLSCKKMARDAFSNSQVQAQLKNFVLLQADVTANDVTDRALEKQLNVIAPPTIIFFDSDGKELKTNRIVGEMNAKEFLTYLCTKLIEILSCVLM